MDRGASTQRASALVRSVIRSIRKHMGLSVVDAARALGVSRATFYRWESGKINITRIVNTAVMVLSHHHKKAVKG